MRTFRRMQARGKTIVLITHDADVAAWADRTVHIRDGKLFSDEEERRYLAELAARDAAAATEKDGAPGSANETTSLSPAAPGPSARRALLLGVPAL